MRKTVLISVSTIILIIYYFSFLFFGIFDRLNLRENRVYIEIDNNCKQKIKDLSIRYVEDAGYLFSKEIIIYDQNRQITKKMPDWYGKDYLLIKINRKTFKHNFGIYKFESWQKIKYKLKLSNLNINSILLKWELKTLWLKKSGIDTVLIQ